jgi:hypothetical protein
MKMLKVPYAEKDEAKALGARWNSARKSWYVPDGVDEGPFARWFAAGGDAPSPVSKDSFSGAPVTGKHYLQLDHDCDPFTSCPVCAAALATSGWTEAHNAVKQMLGTLGK